MKRNSIKWKILKYNIIIVMLLITLTTIIFNISVRLYFEKDIIKQLDKVAGHIEDTALKQGPDFFPEPGKEPPKIEDNDNEMYRYYFMLDRSSREYTSVLNAEYILLDKNKEIITPFPEKTKVETDNILSKINDKIGDLQDIQGEKYVDFPISDGRYTAIIKPVSDKNSFGLGWIIIYSSLEEVNQLQMGINIILFVIVVLSALIIIIFSSFLSKKLSAPFSSLNQHIRSIAERKFGTKIDIPVYDELREVINSINLMSDKLEIHNKAQKTFLQNVSHEFRTPLMSIQGYAEGIKYDVIESGVAADIIMGETKRMTDLVEDLLYLSRLDAIEETYTCDVLSLTNLVDNTIERINGIAISSNIEIRIDKTNEIVKVYGDEEKLSRAITNVVSNCIRYASNFVEIHMSINCSNLVKLTISDDGPGFEENDILHIFDRFYKGKKGHFGLGLAISKNIIERHNGKITAEKSTSGAVFILELPLAN